MKKVGNYTLVGRIGGGQFGNVFKGINEKTKEEFAIKAINKRKMNSNRKLRTLFDTEVAVMKKIKHPNIIHLHDFLETTNNFYLILDYCNGGDLEAHLKKNKSLGEEESIYFLMQISNGFKELHKFKIMHRDFKLANIFLHDDKVVIGDFGFAKSGSEMAETKLGSPFTMAPELLNARGRLRYTNKADLWSVGVCFYQMIFGIPPFSARALSDLQRQVNTRSGRNLRFPPSHPISSECKDLLRKMMDPNPHTRISWYEFFNHKLFDLYNKGKMKKKDMRQSVMFKNHEDKVKNLWKKNQKQRVGEIDLIQDPEKIRIEKTNSEPVIKNSKQKRKRNYSVMRYIHHKKIIVFMMQNCRKLRNLSKQKDKIGTDISISLMKAAILLLTKGIIYNKIAVETIKKKKNTLQLSQFEQFLKSKYSDKIYNELLRDVNIYNSLLTHLQTKLKNDFGIIHNDLKLVYDLSNQNNPSINIVEKLLKTELDQLIQNFKKMKPSLNNELSKEFLHTLGYLYLNTNTQINFPFMISNIKFDWRQFESGLNDEFFNKLMKKII